MASHPFRHFILMATFVITLVACGGGGTQLAGGGIGGTGISQGPITGFGSIFVNGVEFNTDKATIIKDGTTIGPLSTQELKNYLKIGMLVTVNGSIATSTSGSAMSVTYTKDLEGPITALTSDTLTVLGQTVIVDNLTKIEMPGVAVATIADLAINDIVEVSGYYTAGGIRATYIEAKQAGTTQEYELKGTIAAIDATTPTLLTIGTQTVDINGAVFNFTPKVGDYVEVKGTIDTTSGNLNATSMELESRTLETVNADRAELQGYVTSTSSATDFVLNAQPVQINAQTTFYGGKTSDIKPGVMLEVDGSLVNGTLIAAEISFEDDLQLVGNIATIDPSAGSLTLSSYPMISIAFNSILTELEGASSFSAITIGDHIQIRGRMLDSSNCGTTECVLATQLTVGTSTTVSGSNSSSTSSSTDSGSSSSGTSDSGSSSSGSSDTGTSGSTGSTDAELQGPVDSIVPGQSFTVLGTTVNTASITSFSGDNITDSASFFANLAVGDLVDVTGTQVDTTITWDSVDVDK